MLRRAVWLLLLCAVVAGFAAGGTVAQEETAWDALVRENPTVAEETVTSRLERQILQHLTPEQAERFAAGEDPSTIVLADGRDLGRAIEEGFGAPGAVYVPVDSCKLAGAGIPLDDLYLPGDTMITVRGTCGVPTEAVGLVVNAKVRNPTSDGRLNLFPADGGQFNPGFIDFTARPPGSFDTFFNNAVVVELCEGACVAGDLTVRLLETTTANKVHFHTMGYFAPDADADPANELNTSVSLVGTTLQVTDAGGTLGPNLDVGLATDVELGAHVGDTTNPHAVTLGQLTPTTTKGDLLAEDGADVVRLPVGTDGQVLVADSTEPTGLKWVAVGGGGSAFPAPVPKTGQSTSYETGDDGDLERGVAWPAPRFTDNLDGTVTDNLTGLIWLKIASCFGQKLWATALSDANGLADPACGLGDGSLAGDWRLPNVQELQSLIDYGEVSPALPVGHPFFGVVSSPYWSSTTYATAPTLAWSVNLNSGRVARIANSLNYVVWPVRGGQ